MFLDRLHHEVDDHLDHLLPDMPLLRRALPFPIRFWLDVVDAAHDQVEAQVTEVMAEVPLWMCELLYFGRRKAADGVRLDSRAQMLLDFFDAANPPVSFVTVERLREQIDKISLLLDAPTTEMASVREMTIAGPAAPIRLRIYEPQGLGPERSLIVYLHGGGFVCGSLDSHDAVCRQLASETGAVIISVDYRTAPEHRYPAAADDAVAAYTWIHDNARALGSAPDAIAIAGDSAGGNLAAVVSRELVGSGRAAPVAQALIYPVVDLHVETPSRRAFSHGFLLTEELIAWFARHYLGDTVDIEDTRQACLRWSDVSGLPPTLVQTAGFDPLRDEGKAFADRLRKAGVCTTYTCYGDMFHGFINMTKAFPQARVLLAETAAFLRQNLARARRASRAETSTGRRRGRRVARSGTDRTAGASASVH